MLQTNTILPGTLDLLIRMMSNPHLDSFTLVGGTALALQIGHRISVDLDFFGDQEIESDQFFELTHQLGDVQLMSKSSNILVLNINGIKVDFVNYRYRFIKNPIILENVRLASLEDIGAMKLAAITGRGKKRDFYDLFFLLKHFTLSELMKFYCEKYPDGSDFLVMRSLTYFSDAEKDENPRMILPIEWEKVKMDLLNEVKNLNP